MMAKRPATKLPAWRITLIRKRGEYVGTVRAASADDAIRVAIKEFGIEDKERQRRLSAQPLDD